MPRGVPWPTELPSWTSLEALGVAHAGVVDRRVGLACRRALDDLALPDRRDDALDGALEGPLDDGPLDRVDPGVPVVVVRVDATARRAGAVDDRRDEAVEAVGDEEDDDDADDVDGDGDVVVPPPAPVVSAALERLEDEGAEDGREGEDFLEGDLLERRGQHSEPAEQADVDADGGRCTP